VNLYSVGVHVSTHTTYDHLLENEKVQHQDDEEVQHMENEEVQHQSGKQITE
jgi:hypothetical protein